MTYALDANVTALAGHFGADQGMQDDAIALADAKASTFASRADAVDAIIPAPVSKITVLEAESLIEYRAKPGAGALVTAGGRTWEYAGGTLGASINVSIPAQYPSINAAVQALSVLRVKPEVTINLRVDTAHLITEPAVFRNGDWSHFVLHSSPTVIIDPAAVLRVGPSFPANRGVIEVINARGPRLAAMIDAQGNANQGIYMSGGKMVTLGGYPVGIRNVASILTATAPDGVGLFLNDLSEFFGPNLLIEGCGYRSVHCTGGSTFKAHFSTYRNSGEFNIFITRGCKADLSNGVVIEGGTFGLVVRRSIVAADGIDISGCSSTGVSAENCSNLNMRLAAVESCPVGVRAIRGSSLAMTEGSVTGSSAGQDLMVLSGGYIDATNTTTTNGAGNPAAQDTNIGILNWLTGKGIITSEAAATWPKTTTSTNERTRTEWPDGMVEETGVILADMTSAAAQTLNFMGTFIEAPHVVWAVSGRGTQPVAGSNAQAYGAVAAIRAWSNLTQFRIDKASAAEGLLTAIPVRYTAKGRWKA